jgi:cyclopropane-fatty-acyl-phospholipid synthase
VGGVAPRLPRHHHDDQRRPYPGTPDWIEKHIFPGGERASLGEILASVARATSLSLHTCESFGWHYARTLREWRARFHAAIDQVRAMGFDEPFIRKWDFYLAICEAAFLERHTSVYQLLLVKNGAARPWYNDAAFAPGGAIAPAREEAAMAMAGR